MPQRLRRQAMTRIHENDRHIRSGRSRRHVARVLLMAGRVGDDELPSRRGKIPVRHVDRDPLLALRLQPVGQQRKIDRPCATGSDRLFLRDSKLIFIDGFRVVQQPANQRGLAVIHAAGRRKAQQVSCQGAALRNSCERAASMHIAACAIRSSPPASSIPSILPRRGRSRGFPARNGGKSAAPR